MAETTSANKPANEPVNSPPAVPVNADLSELPVTPEGITASWLSSVLKTKIESIEITKMIWGTASKALVTINYGADSEGAEQNTTRPTRVCIKGTFDPAFVEQAPFIVAVYHREVDFFNLLAPALGHMELPRSLWAGRGPGQGIVVMEDLAAARGAVFAGTRDDWPVARALAAVEQLAALHAATWGARPADYPWIAPGAYEAALLALARGYDATVRGPGRVPLPDGLRCGRRVEDALRKAFRSQNPRFRCVVHGDAHIGNTYLDAEGEGEGEGEPRFVDFQTVMIWPAFHDVAYLVGGALGVADRRAHEWEVVDHYLAALHRLGGPRLESADPEVVVEYRVAMIAGVGWLMCPTAFQPLENINPMCARHAAALEDHRTLELIESLPEVE